MRQLVQLIERALQHKTTNAKAPATRTDTLASSRVLMYTNNSTRQTISTTPPNPQVPQLSTPPVPSVDQSTKTTQRQRTKKHKNKFQPTAPAHNTRSRIQATVPASRTNAHTLLKKIKTKHRQGTQQQHMQPYRSWKIASTKLWR